MIDSVTNALLQDIVRREGRSLLQYASESFPWASHEEPAALGQIAQMVAEEQQGAAALIRLMYKKRVAPPYLGAYPMTFTNFNYMSLDYFLPLLIDHQKQHIADLETYISRIADSDAAAAVHHILDYKRRHLQTLQSMTRPQPGLAA